jgi:uncharacterized membrane protein YcaP (DUF421 family)
MNWLVSGWSELAEVVAKAALMYVTALVALRLGERRTLAQWTIIDFATAVAMGAIIGRTAIAAQSYLSGAVALITLVLIHRAASVLRFNPVFGKLLDHRVRVLVENGRIRDSELRRCGLTDHDLYRELRQRGVFDVRSLRYVLYESKGSISLVSEESGEAGGAGDAADGAEGTNAPLLDEALRSATDYP